MQRAAPMVVPETEPFWKGMKEGKLLLPYCNSCQATFFYPRPLCPRCHSWDVTWMESSGLGTVYAFTIAHVPMGEGFTREDCPYVMALVELEGGARLLTNLVGAPPDPEHVRIGLPVELAPEEVNEEITLPLFRPRGGGV